MSRKSNKLKARLSAAEECLESLRRQVAELRRRLREAESKPRDDFPVLRGLAVACERDFARYDQYAIRVTFMPDLFIHGIINGRRDFVNVTDQAERIGWEIGRKVAHAIAERLKKEAK